MSPTSRGPLTLASMVCGAGKNVFRSRAKYLVALVSLSLACVWVLAILFLPERGLLHEGSSMNKVYRVYKGVREAGEAVEAGDLPGPRKEEDLARLRAQMDLDEEIDALRGQRSPPPRRTSVAEGPSDPKTPLSGSPKCPTVQGGEDVSVKEKRDTIREMMSHAWGGYAEYAWGANELRPVSLREHSGSVFGTAQMGATIVDGMDTLYLMGMTDEYNKGRDWIEQYLDFNHMTGDVSVFETNIRYVGGLLSLFSLTGDDLYREKAVHVADKLLPAFKTPTGIPHSLVNVKTGTSKNYGWASGSCSILAEFGTLHMEFAYLSEITGNPEYLELVKKVRKVVSSTSRNGKLYPNYFNPRTGKWGQDHTSVGALGDSFYEYLLKEWVRSGKQDQQAKKMFDEAALDIETELVKTSRNGLIYIAEKKYGRIEDKMDHLACFAGGMYGLAAREEKDSNSDRWIQIAAGITNTCHEAYDRTATKIGPEAFWFTDNVEAASTKSNERYYILRPETVEAYFMMWRITHEQKYRDWGWEAVQAIEKYCKTEGGYSGIRDVYSSNPSKDDVQQSFFVAETLKYLYLLFSDDSLISLDEWVFNTEAHPLPIKGANLFHRGI